MMTHNINTPVDQKQALEIIQLTLKEIRGLPSATHNPLQAGLSIYMQQLRCLDAKAHQLIKQELHLLVATEDDLGTRFLLRLISDATESMIEQRPLPYLAV